MKLHRVISGLLLALASGPLEAASEEWTRWGSVLHSGPLAEATPESFHATRHRIPAFSRQYRTACSTCHTAAPKLNVLGETFRLNGYRMPENQLLIREDDPVSLGDEGWKDQWPRAIWPGDVPGLAPLALRMVSDIQATRDESVEYDLTYRFPGEIYILGGTSLGQSIGAFFESEWTRTGGLEVLQAKLKFQDVIPSAPRGVFNLWMGLQNPYLFTFADRQIDRAGRQRFTWQNFRASDLRFTNPTSGQDLVSRDAFRLGGTQPALELTGTATPRLYYGLGFAQGTGLQSTDNNTHKDLYYKLRYKFGGLNLRGQYDVGGGPVMGTGGQLLDHSLIVEHFGYFGEEPAAGGVPDEHRSFGIAVRALWGATDAGAGYVRTTRPEAFGTDARGNLVSSSFFAKVEYLFLPWVMGELKAEHFDASVPDRVMDAGFTRGGLTRTLLMPGVIFLLRQNVRAVVEGELFTEDSESASLGRNLPHNLWIRLDVAF